MLCSLQLKVMKIQFIAKPNGWYRIEKIEEETKGDSVP